MRAAQKLYEAGHITYMRTDSVNLSTEAVAVLLTVVEKEYGKESVEARVYKTTSKNAQEAHEAVRPSDPTKKKAGATPDEIELYELIRTRTLASQMVNAVLSKTSVKVAADKDIPLFSANGSRVLSPGWLACDTKARGEDVELPKLTVEEIAKLLDLISTEKQTEPPNRYTEAGLIKELEKRGIGRPSTYASIMKTIQDRGYVEKNGRTLMPTATGMVVSGWLEENFTKYISDSFTAEMEDELDEIARGERKYRETLQEFYTPFAKDILAGDLLPKATSLGDAGTEFPCPLCKSPMEFKLGRGGIFMSCKRYPDCKGARREDGAEMKEDEPIGIHPDTKMPIFVRTGRFGPYVEMPLDTVRSDELVVDSKEPTTTKKRKTKKEKKPKINAKRASVPAGIDPLTVTLEDAVRYLTLPRELGIHSISGKPIVANVGRFGPYIAHDGEFRSIKKGGDPYTITFEEAAALLAEPKKLPRGVDKAYEIGKHPKTGRALTLYQAKQGLFLKKGLRRIHLPEGTNPETFTASDAAEYLK
jgi:DNA topoisomerase-1